MRLKEYIRLHHYNSQTHFSRHTKIPRAQINMWLKKDCYHVISGYLCQRKREIIMFKPKTKNRILEKNR